MAGHGNREVLRETLTEIHLLALTAVASNRGKSALCTRWQGTPVRP
jgi:hypothetical protein